MMIPPWIRWRVRFGGSLLTIKYTLFIGICFWGLYALQTYRIPGRFLPELLPWIGVALGVLNFILLINHFLLRLPTDDVFYRRVARIEYAANIVILLFAYYCVVAYVNGRMSTSPIDRKSSVLSISHAQLNWGEKISLGWVDLAPLERETEPLHVLLQGHETASLWGGEKVIVQTRSGHFGFPYVTTIRRDEEYYYLEALRLAPTSSGVWRKLIILYWSRHDWKAVNDAVQQYLRAYAYDYRFLLSVGGALVRVGERDKGIPLLEYVIANHPTYQAYQFLGWAVEMNGDNNRAVQIFEQSIALAPDFWEAYFHLGEVYANLGQYEKGIAFYQEALKRHPSFLEIEARIAILKKKTVHQK